MKLFKERTEKVKEKLIDPDVTSDEESPKPCEWGWRWPWAKEGGVPEEPRHLLMGRVAKANGWGM